MIVSSEEIFLNKYRNFILQALKHQNDIRAQPESQILAWEKERHKYDRLCDEQSEVRHVKQRSIRERA